MIWKEIVKNEGKEGPGGFCGTTGNEIEAFPELSWCGAYGDALILLDEDLSRMYCIQKLIYGEIAEKRNCTAISVERNMRTFLKHAWEEGDRKVLDDLAGYHMEKRPSNKRFLDLLLMRYQESMDEI